MWLFFPFESPRELQCRNFKQALLLYSYVMLCYVLFYFQVKMSLATESRVQRNETNWKGKGILISLDDSI